MLTYQQFLELLEPLSIQIRIPITLCNSKGHILQTTLADFEIPFAGTPLDCDHQQPFMIKKEKQDFYHILPTPWKDSYLYFGPLRYSEKKANNSAKVTYRLLDDAYFSDFSFAFRLIKGEQLDDDYYKQALVELEELWLEKELKLEEFQQREEMRAETSYQKEKSYLQHIKQGNKEEAIQVLQSIIQIAREISANELFRRQYLYVAVIAVTSRSLIECGVPCMHAYAMSDIYIKKLDAVITYAQIEELLIKATSDFCSLVMKFKYSTYPHWVRKVMEYINEHSHETISLTQLSTLVNLTPAYLSVAFKKESGESITSYIQKIKIEEAKYLIAHTDASILTIATSLAYSSQTYFTKIFKKYTGYLPLEYRKQHKW